MKPTTNICDTNNNTSDFVEFERQNPFFYGEELLIDDSDMPFYFVGGIYMLPDNNGTTNTFHPYILLDNIYNSKVDEIHFLGITSTPSIIDLVPIKCNDGLTFINPHKSYIFSIKTLKRYKNFVGAIKQEPFTIALQMYTIKCGCLSQKSRKEVWDEFYVYKDAFFKTNPDIKPLKRKYEKEQNIEREMTIKLTTSEVKISECIKQFEQLDQYDQPNYEQEVIETKPESIDDQKYSVFTIDRTDPNQKPLITIHLKDATLLSRIEKIKALPTNHLKMLPEMTDEDIIIFLAIKELTTIKETAKIYHCSGSLVSMRLKQISMQYRRNYLLH